MKFEQHNCNAGDVINDVLRVTDYQVVFSYSLEHLLRQVQGEIAKGWEPQGGLAHTFQQVGGSQQHWYHQALILRDRSKK